jgi:hypothetical protein
MRRAMQMRRALPVVIFIGVLGVGGTPGLGSTSEVLV